MNHTRKLICVYNANAGKINALLDTAHKILSPKTYACQLCNLTFDTFSENKRWKKFRRATPFPMVFLHKDEFEQHYVYDTKYPVIFLQSDGKLEEFVSEKTINSLESIEALIKLLETKLLATNLSMTD